MKAERPNTCALQHAISALRNNEDFRVWSVLVSIFGDLAGNPGDQISGAALSRLTENMGIKPEATRVALHRLRKDGWIVSEKSGRTSKYQLSPVGYAESQRVRARIYAKHTSAPTQWHLLIDQPVPQSQRLGIDAAKTSEGYLVVSPGVYLGHATPCPTESFLRFDGKPAHVPDWLRAAIAPPELTASYASLEASLRSVLTILASAPVMQPLDIATLRSLVVHNWRRILLRHIDLPAQFYTKTWRGNVCRGLVSDLLDQLPKPDILTL